MKISIRKSAAVVAALSMATTGALMLNQNKADAATVATVNSGTTARLYTDQGQLVMNRALAPNTPWLVGKIQTINGETMYQVATNEYLSSKDSNLNGPTQKPSNKLIVTVRGHNLPVYDDTTKSQSNRALGKDTSWQVGKIVKNANGDTYYQVSTHEYLLASSNAMLNNYDTDYETNKQYIADFMIKGGTSSNTDTDTNTSTTPSTNTNNNNSGNTTVTTPSTDQNNNSNVIDTQSIKAAFMDSINKERASKGLSQLTTDAQVQKMADIRVDEAIQTHSHYRPDGTKWYTLLPELGITYTTGGENLALEFKKSSADAMAESTMQSFRNETYAQNHYDNVMNPKITKMGVAVKYDSMYEAYQIVEEFIG